MCGEGSRSLWPRLAFTQAKPMSRRLTLVTYENLNLDFRVKMGEGTLDTGRLKLPTMVAEKDPF